MLVPGSAEQSPAPVARVAVARRAAGFLHRPCRSPHKVALKAWILDPDEVREIEGFNPRSVGVA